MPKQDEKYPTIHQIGGVITDVRRLVDPNNKNWGATNPSIGYHAKKGFVLAIRSSNYVIMGNGSYTVTEGSTIKSHVWFAELDDELKCKNLRRIDVSDLGIDLDRGLEDPKLFWRDGAWHFTCVTMEQGHTPVARMAIAKLDAKCKKVVDLKKFKGIDAERPEKNWMLPYEPNENFDFIYGPNQIVKDGVLTTYMTDHPAISMLRGNTNLHLMEDGTYLGVMHRTFVKQQTNWVPTTFGTTSVYLRSYVHYFVQFDSKGMIIALSRGFNFYKPGVEFAAGLVVKGKNALISFGREDISSHIATMPMETIQQSLLPVKY
jgi:hypothetical protein